MEGRGDPKRPFGRNEGFHAEACRLFHQNNLGEEIAYPLGIAGDCRVSIRRNEQKGGVLGRVGAGYCSGHLRKMFSFLVRSSPG